MSAHLNKKHLRNVLDSYGLHDVPTGQAALVKDVNIYFDQFPERDVILWADIVQKGLIPTQNSLVVIDSHDKGFTKIESINELCNIQTQWPAVVVDIVYMVVIRPTVYLLVSTSRL